ncbi:glycosyltransferase family 4 protein [Mobilitalea sibirica]|uniref:Glycosyltransferase family 4 protein n=1 Tax=Mobilitalea sibirica TaxID=1462919 RepID=A0A8J7H426_9FIRM|nr:glycosyltransferase family 4 protein [Mobilitalea sibirica]MBH1942058.1 glycosyltransferase family 4 protein [Mobilitalea sibirica]
MKNIIFLSYLNLWSMDKNKGAPSFYRTIEGYINDGWNVVLINPQYEVGASPKIEGLTNITFKPVFYPLCKIKKVSFIGRILHSLHGSLKLFLLGRKVLQQFGGKAIIYSYEVNSAIAGNKLRHKFNLPFVTRFQGTVLYPIKNNWYNRLKFYPHFQALEINADITIMTDDGTLGDKVLERLDNQSTKVFFWRNGVDISYNEPRNETAIKDLRSKYNISSSDEVLITVSRLASWKKVNRAIEALSVITKERKNCKLIIVGDGDDKENLISLTNKLNLNNNVIFAGAIPQSEVKNYLNLADIFLSLYDLSNVGNPLLEAMSCGKPIITLNVGDTSSIIKHESNGILLEVEELSKIPQYINKILDNKEYSIKLGRQAKEFSKVNFRTWKNRIDMELNEVNELYNKYL